MENKTVTLENIRQDLEYELLSSKKFIQLYLLAVDLDDDDVCKYFYGNLKQYIEHILGDKLEEDLQQAIEDKLTYQETINFCMLNFIGDIIEDLTV